jgi:hypothetical protein
MIGKKNIFLSHLAIKAICLFFIISFSSNSSAQTFFESADSLNKRRLIATHTGLGVAYAGSMIGLAQVWYKNQESQGFQLFNDSKHWLQMDKIGHTYSAYWMQNRAFSMYRCGRRCLVFCL